MSQVTRRPNGRKVPGPLWLWRAGPGMPDLDLIWRAYLHRFDIEHTAASHGRVRRYFSRLATLAGTPASPPKPSKAGPERPKGRHSTPATRCDVMKKGRLTSHTG